MRSRPNELVERIHSRMPVIVRTEHYDFWMDPAMPVASLVVAAWLALERQRLEQSLSLFFGVLTRGLTGQPRISSAGKRS